MRALLMPEIARHMGIVLLKPGKELMGLFSGGRILIERQPDSMKDLPSGRIADARQLLAEDPTLTPFFLDARVVRAAGGVTALEDWLGRNVSECQWPHSNYHHRELVMFRHEPGSIVACWHCDNELRNQNDKVLDELIARNLADWVIECVRIKTGCAADRMLSLAELCWWAVSEGIGDAITENMASRSLGLKDDPFQSVYKESEIVPSYPAADILAERISLVPVRQAAAEPQPEPKAVKPVVQVQVDPEAPATLFARPKRIRWISPRFIEWVKTQPCACCGQPADDAHHLIGWGQGGMATRAHDIFTIPLCRVHHRQLHDNPAAFEREYAPQPVLIIQLLDRAYALGVLA